MNRTNETNDTVAKKRMKFRCEPVVLLALIENDLEAAEKQCDQHEPDPVDVNAAGDALAALALKYLGFASRASSPARARAAPIGPLMRKIQCQDRLSVSQPPSVGPTVGATSTATP